MKNIIDYAKNYSKTFLEKQFNEVDALVLAQLSYLNLSEIWVQRKGDPLKITDLALIDDENIYKVRRGEDNKRLVKAMAEGVRFRDIIITEHVTVTDPKIDEQFSATVYSFNNTAFLAYRGTDRSLVGWSENFNMTYMDAVPSEIDSVIFINRLKNKLPSHFYIGGHSKGGHLSMFASTYCDKEIQKKIIRIFNFDGPGLSKTISQSKEFRKIEDKIITILPETSIFGIMLINTNSYYVVKSNGLLLSQHEPFLWAIKYNSFVYERSLSPISRRLKKSMATYINNTDPKKRELFFKVLNDFIDESGGSRPLDLTLNFVKTVPIFFSTYDNLPKEDLAEVKAMMWELIKMVTTIQTHGHSEFTFRLVEGLKINQEKSTQEQNKKQNKDIFRLFKPTDKLANKQENKKPDNNNEEEVKPDENLDEIVLKKAKVSNGKYGNSRSGFDIKNLLDFTGKQLDLLLNKIITPVIKPPQAKEVKNNDDEVAINPNNIIDKNKDNPTNNNKK